MKAKYMSPEMVVVELEATHSLLAGSMKVYTDEIPGTGVLSREFEVLGIEDFDFEE